MPRRARRELRLPVAPAASADPSVKADFLEVTAFAVADRNRSLADLVQLTRRSGTVEALINAEGDHRSDAGAEASQAAAEDALAELEDRFEACGGNSGSYPYEVLRTSIQLREGGRESIYTFLLLLSYFGLDAGPRGAKGERVFEEVCRCAAEGYFGGSSAGAEAVHFGFPRRVLPRQFPAALDQLCKLMGDAIAKDDAPRSKSQKDAKLDIAVWKHFPDRRAGKLVALGQCAAGKNAWRQKATELQLASFCGRWLRERPSVEPIRMFFIPHRLERDDHRDVCLDGGILFDRCRIAHFAEKAVPTEVLRECIRWSRHVIRRKLRR